MDEASRHCAQLIDDVEIAITASQKTMRDGSRVVVSSDRHASADTENFRQSKNRLLAAMRETFIEPRTKSLKESALLIFCYHSGTELVTQDVADDVEASFLLRTAGFDVVVKSF